MRKNEDQPQNTIEIDEQGTEEVSQQILDVYNSGCIDRENSPRPE